MQVRTEECRSPFNAHLYELVRSSQKELLQCLMNVTDWNEGALNCSLLALWEMQRKKNIFKFRATIVYSHLGVKKVFRHHHHQCLGFIKVAWGVIRKNVRRELLWLWSVMCLLKEKEFHFIWSNRRWKVPSCFPLRETSPKRLHVDLKEKECGLIKSLLSPSVSSHLCT